MSVTDWITRSCTSCRQMDAALPAWRIKRPVLLLPRALRIVRRNKADLLSVTLKTYESLFLYYSEDPRSDGLAGQWSTAGEETWRVPLDVDADKLLDWLYVGGWCLYSSDRPIDPSLLNLLDLAPSAVAITDFVRQYDLAVLIVAFHDNDPWTVATGA